MTTDELFILGWLRNPATSGAGVRLLAEKCKSYSGRILSEADSIAVFVEPFLRGLGWDTLDNDQAGRESRRQDPICDMQLLVHGKVAVVIEAKPLDHDPILRRYLGQLEGDILGRLVLAGARASDGRMTDSQKWNEEHRLEDGDGNIFVYGVLTNGRRWFVLDFSTDVPSATTSAIHARPLIPEEGFDLTNCDEHGIATIVKVLSPESVLDAVRKWKVSKAPRAVGNAD